MSSHCFTASGLKVICSSLQDVRHSGPYSIKGMPYASCQSRRGNNTTNVHRLDHEVTDTSKDWSIQVHVSTFLEEVNTCVVAVEYQDLRSEDIEANESPVEAISD